MSAGKIRPVRRACAFYFYMGILYGSFSDGINIRQHRTIPALRLKHRSGSCGTASALPKCSIMSGCGTRIVLRGQKPLAFCDRCPCFGSLFPPLAALTFAASSIICAFGLASAAPRTPYRHLELCGIALDKIKAYAHVSRENPASQESMCFLFLYGHSVWIVFGWNKYKKSCKQDSGPVCRPFSSKFNR